MGYEGFDVTWDARPFFLPVTVTMANFNRLNKLSCILPIYAVGKQARNQDFMWGGANEAKADPTTEMYFLSSDPFI